jgi:hypothetical protein
VTAGLTTVIAMTITVRVWLTFMAMRVAPMFMIMPMAMPMLVLMPVRAIIGLERRCHLDAGKSMLREERLDLGPLLQPDTVG